jgi:PAS domain S-box-containing protein
VEPLHSLLARQLKGRGGDLSAVPDEWRVFVEAVDKAYRQFDEDRTMLERSLDLSSQELIQANADLQAASEARFHATFNQAAVGLAHVSPQGQFMLVNRRLCEMLGYSEAELKRKTVKDVSVPEDRDITDDLVRRLHSGVIDKFSVEKRYLHSSGAALWVNVTVAHIRRSGGQLDYDVSVVEDITERKQIEQALERMAKYDTLSGLPNRNLDRKSVV